MRDVNCSGRLDSEYIITLIDEEHPEVPTCPKCETDGRPNLLISYNYTYHYCCKAGHRWLYTNTKDK